jgi:hypothetical protein
MQRERLAVTAVASALSVTPKTVYEWLRGKGPLHPDHVRAELLQKLTAAKDKPRKIRGGALQQVEVSGRRLHEPLVPDATARRVNVLPPAYQDRYQARLKEITIRARRELDEYLKVLEAEYRTAQDRQPRRD